MQMRRVWGGVLEKCSIHSEKEEDKKVMSK